MNETRIIEALTVWFAAHARDLPWRQTRDPYAVWVSEVMLQQTQVKTVLTYWRRWMRVLPDIASLAAVDAGKLHKLWEGLGYYTRVRNLQQAARLIVARHDGRFPKDFEAVLDLPGIGRYTAGAVCSIAFDQPHPILDGNVIRVLTRLFGIPGRVRERETNRRLWQLAEDLVKRTCRRQPKGSPSLFNQSLMELGALVCTPRQPRCGDCPVSDWCSARQHSHINDLPNLGPRPGTLQRRFAAFLVRDGRRFLVRHRPAGGVNAHLWEFPNLELASQDDAPREAAQRLFGFGPETIELLGVLKHSITCNRITLEVFALSGCPRLSASGVGEWLTAHQMARLPFTAAHKKIRLRFAPAGARRLKA